MIVWSADYTPEITVVAKQMRIIEFFLKINYYCLYILYTIFAYKLFSLNFHHENYQNFIELYTNIYTLITFLRKHFDKKILILYIKRYYTLI